MYTKAKMYQTKVEWEGGHYQGDIDVMGEKGDLPKITYFNAVPKELLWPENTIYYCIRSEYYDMEQISKIEEAAQEIMRKTGCIYIFRTNKGTKENYLEIEPSGVCSSFVGMKGGAQRLSLNRSCMFNIGTILHEFMHALGFHHEHCRGNRNDNVKVDWENIHEDHWGAFNKVDESHSGPYDFGSVMHFGQRCFAKDQMKDTLSPIKSNHVKVGQREKLSELDVERIRILYGDLRPEDSKYFRAVKYKDLYKPAIWLPKNADTKKQSPTKSQMH